MSKTDGIGDGGGDDEPNVPLPRFIRTYPTTEAQKPKTFRIAAYYAQKFSGRSA